MIATRPEESYLIRRLVQALPELRDHLGDAQTWRGVEVSEPDRQHAYQRLIHDHELCVEDRRFVIAINVFERPSSDGELHDHRWPLAVLPLDLDGVRDVPLYDMPWESATASGTVRVCSHQPWAIEHCRDVRHAVRGLRPHLSIVLGDRTEPPSRGQRLVARPLDVAVTEAILARASALL